MNNNQNASTSNLPLPSLDSTWRRQLYLLVLVTYLAAVFGAMCNARPLLSANDRSRWCTVWALVERGTYKIDEIDAKRKWRTIDKVFHEGHFYSSKPPLLATLVAGVYWCVKHTTGLTLLENTEAVTRIVLFLFNGLPMLVALVLLVRLAERYMNSDWGKLYFVVAASFGTMLTPFLMTLNNHVVATTSLVFAVYVAVRILVENERRGIYFALAGFWTAFVCCNELPAVMFGLVMFVLLCRADWKKTLVWYVPAALVPIAAFLFTNYLVTGGLKPFYAYFGTKKYLYPGSYWRNPKGIDKGGDSPLVYLFHCTFGHHGIFSLSPIFLLSLAVWFRPQLVKRSSLSTFVWFGAGMLVWVLGFYLSRTANYNYGGNTSGLRWTYWVIPLLLISMMPALDAWASNRRFRLFALIVLAVSVFSAFFPIANPWQQPWLFRLLQSAGWIHYG